MPGQEGGTGSFPGLEWVSSVPDNARAGLLSLIAESVGDQAILGFTAPLAHDESEAWLARLDADLRAGRLLLLLARSKDGTVEGMVALEPGGLATQRHHVTVRRAFLRASRRGSHVLLYAVLQILAQCEARGWTTLLVDVREGTAAERLWRRLGFREYGRLEDYARHAGRIHAGIFLTTTPEEIACIVRPLLRRPQSSPKQSSKPRSKAS